MGKYKFDTKVQWIKYRVLSEVARYTYKGTLLENMTSIPKIISPGPESTMRCCIYKERAIVSERINLAVSGVKKGENVISVINIACDECPLDGYEITTDCRGCLAHRCSSVCPKDAISFDEKLRAHIDKSKCINCGLCAKACPYNAINNRKRPCVVACKEKYVKAYLHWLFFQNEFSHLLLYKLNSFYPLNPDSSFCLYTGKFLHQHVCKLIPFKVCLFLSVNLLAPQAPVTSNVW